MAFSADGRFSLSAAGGLSSHSSMLSRRGGLAPAFVDGELMGKKVKVESIVRASRVENRVGRSYVCMSIATDFASDTRVCMHADTLPNFVLQYWVTL